MGTKEEILNTLRNLKPDLLTRFKVKEIGLFGSFAREEQSATSDVDLLTSFTEDATLFDLIRLALFLEEKLQRRVDVVPKHSLRAKIRDTVLQETALI